MKNFTQSMFIYNSNSFRKFAVTFGLLIALMFCNVIYAQPSIMRINQDVSGTYTNTDMTLRGAAFWARFQENGTGTSSGTRNWQFNSDSYSNTWGARANNTLAAYNTVITPNTGTASGNWANACSPGCYNTFGKLPATQANNYYTYNILRGTSYASQNISVLETSYNPTTISTVSQAAGTLGSRAISITTSGTPASGENIFVRYSTNSYTNSTIVQATGSGTSWTASIPWQSSAVSFYVYSSNRTLAEINAAVTSNGQSAHDLLTLNLNNNGGSNYSWTPTVISGNVVVFSTGGTGAAGVSYTSLTNASGAFLALNGGTAHTGTVQIYITADVTTEAGTNGLSASAAWTSMVINPIGARTISGAAAAGSPLINLNGADNVNIDGLNTGGNSLTISNTTVSSTVGTSTIRFIADAINNTIQNCTISGSSTVVNSVTNAGGTILFSTGTTTGNDGNIITNNTITAAGVNIPSCAIYGLGTSASVDNSGISITNNNIQDYFSAANNSFGVYVANFGSTWTITGNKFFQTATRTSSAGSTHEGIKVNSGNGYVISNNFIGAANSSGTGTTSYAGGFTNRYIAIDLSVGTTTATSVQGNTISNLNLSTTSGATSANGIFTGIYVTAGNVNIGTTTGNIIGNTGATNFIFITSTSSLGLINGIASSSTGTVNIQNNTIASFGNGGSATIGYTVNAINTSGAAGNYTISANTIGSSTLANSIAVGVSATTTAVNTFIGINNTATGTISITNNFIQNITLHGAATASPVGKGIQNTATANISGNTISDMTAAGTGAVINAIELSGGTTVNVNANKIYNISVSAAVTAASVAGIAIPSTNPTTANIYNNTIGLLSAPAGNGDNLIRGIALNATTATTTNNVFHNTIYITGTSSGAALGSSGVSHVFSTTATSGTLNLRNNIIYCTAQKGTGRAVAIRRTAATNLNNYATTSNNNLLFAGTASSTNLIYFDGTNSDQTIAAFQSRMGATRENSTLAENTSFQSIVGSNANFLRIAAGTTTNAESGAVLITTPNINTDYWGIARPFPSPTNGGTGVDIGASEFDGIVIPPTITLATNSIAAGTLNANTTNNVLYSFSIAVTGKNASLTGLNITTTGTYATADITNFKVYYQATTPFVLGSATLLSTFTNVGGAGSITFPSFTAQTIVAGATGYIFITADVPCTVANAATVIVSAVTGSNTTFAQGTATGTPAGGNTQTTAAATLNDATSFAASLASLSSSLSWVAPTGCYNEIMIVAAPATNTGTPTGDGSAYSESLTYGSGTGLGNGFVVYKGTTSPQVVTGLTNGTTYYFKIFTRNDSTWSSGVEINRTPGASYCAATGNTTFQTGTTLVNFSNLNNSTPTKTAGYNDYTSQTATVTIGVPYNLTTNVNTAGNFTVFTRVYIDWDQNGTFNTTVGSSSGSGETYLLGSAVNVTNGVTSLSPLSITVPSSATVGTTRMRVITFFASGGTDPFTGTTMCNNSGFDGEVEDYSVAVSAPPPPTITSLGTSSGCIGTSITINGTNLLGATASTITIGGTAVSSITSNNGSTLVAVIASGFTGTGTVSVTTAGGTATFSSFTVNALPTATWASAAANVCSNASAQTTTLAYTATTNTPTSYSITWNGSPSNSFVPVTNQSNTFSPPGAITIDVPAATAAGTYTGTITVTNANGCTSSAVQTFTILVNASPTATATNGGPYCSGSTIQLTGGPSGLSNYAWSGPNSYSVSGAGGTGISENFNVATTGWTYTNITLSSLQSCTGNGLLFDAVNDAAITPSIINPGTLNFNIKRSGTATPVMSVEIQISDASPVSQTSGPWNTVTTVGAASTTTCAAVTSIDLSAYTGLRYIRFIDTRASGTQQRGIDDVVITSLAPTQSPTIATATTAMSGLYTLTTTNAVGCTATASTTVTVNPLPQGSLTANGPFCATGTGQLTWTSTSGTGPFTVVYNDGTANQTATGVVSGTPFTVVTTPVTSTTTYTLVSVTDSSSTACARTTGFTGTSATITVSPTPTTADAGPDQIVCAANTIALAANTATSGTGVWSIIGGSGGTVTTPSSPTSTFTGTTGTTYTLQWTISSGTCTASTDTVSITILSSLDYVNLQFPGSATICQGGTLTAYGQVYEPGVTPGAGQGANITVEFGYNLTNDTNPSTWSNWFGATYNSAVTGNNDEYQYTFTPPSSGTFYYTFRYRQGTCDTWQYGGYSAGGGNFWDGTTYVSGVLTVNSRSTAAVISGTASICSGSSTNLQIAITGGTSPYTVVYTSGSASSYTSSSNISVSPSSTTTYTITSVTDANGCVGIGNSGSAVVTLTTTTTTDGGTTWSNGTPTSTTSIVYDGSTGTIGANMSGCSLSLINNAVVTVSSGFNVTLSGAITVSSGSTFTLNNNANLLQGGTTNNNSGNIVVKRNSSLLKRFDYTLWSSPVSGQGLYAFSPLTFANRFYVYRTNTNFYNNADIGFSISGLDSNGVNGTDGAGIQFATAKGYLIRTPWNHPTVATVWNGTFTGVPNNGDINYTMTSGAEGFRFNLVGNPYPSPMSMSQFVSDNSTKITGTLYFWRESNNNTSNNAYCTWAGGTFTTNNEAQVVNPNGIIRTGQGFFVEALASQTTLSFKNGQRTSDNSNQFFRTTENTTNSPTTIETNRFWLNLTNSANAFSQMAAGYMTDATDGVDMYDGKNINTGNVLLNSILDNTDYTIQGKSLPFNTADVIPLSYKITDAGNYTITLDHTDGLFTDVSQPIYVKDNLTASYHDLQTGAYNFASDAGTFTNRFEIVYALPLGIENPVFTANTVIIYNQNNEFVVNTGTTIMSSIKVFDIRGRLLQEKTSINASQTTIGSGLANQVLLVQITSEDGVTVTKKVVR